MIYSVYVPSNGMIARSLAEIISSKKPITGIILQKSADLLCSNLFCEQVGMPCVCRLDRILGRHKLASVKSLDLSGNQLPFLPPSLGNLTELEHLDLSYNCLHEVPECVLTLPKLKVLDISHNPSIKQLSNYQDRGFIIKSDAKDSKP